MFVGENFHPRGVSYMNIIHGEFETLYSFIKCINDNIAAGGAVNFNM